MSNFKIVFSNPWFLLLLIPAIIFTLVPYFRMNKRYRCTRNRIVSIVLHLVVFALATLLLSGLRIDYDIPNEENEVIVLIDASESGDDRAEDIDEFLRGIIDAAGGDFKLGIVSFGFDQVYAVPLTRDTENIYNNYLEAPLPDTTATDIESALNFAASLFEYPNSARIVLLSDALETDGHAVKNAVKSIASRGIKIDTVYFEGDEAESEVQIVSMERPEGKINVAEPFDVKLSLISSYTGTATITPYDTGTAGAPITIELVEGLQTIDIPFEFALPGLHKMSFELSANGDTLTENNQFHSYIYLDILNKILVIESIDGESDRLTEVLNGELDATVMSIRDENLPTTVDGLRAFDEIILCNISNADMPTGFDEALKSYVHDFGGGLFTICGNKPDDNPQDENWTANAYTRLDMFESIYQDMLPVEVINYTPPTAVIILIDRSGSMSTYPDGKPLPESENKLLFAKSAAEACINLLSERDYVGIMSFYDNYTEHLELTPRTQRDKILSAVEDIPVEGNGGTVLSYALEHAGLALKACDVENKHIIIITDGEPSSADSDRYKQWFKNNAEEGITTSIVGVNCSSGAKSLMQSLLANEAGGSIENFHDVQDLNSASSTIKKDFEVSKITDVNYGKFTPEIAKFSAITHGISPEDMPALYGFYGLKAKEDAEVILMGTYTPVYAQWNYGAGTVGTFACDLNGTWSGDFLNSEAGATIINNIVNYLFPDMSIAARDVEVEVEGDNYKTRLDIFTDLVDGEYLEITVTPPDGSDGELIQIRVGEKDTYSRIDFAVTTPGIHEILVQKYSADATLISETVCWRALSYSLEYNEFPDRDAAELYAKAIAEDGRGEVVTEPEEIYENAVEFRHISLDPRILFSIIIIVLFLLDIAVRKFKWKWLHEIIRDKRAERAMSDKKR